MPTDITVTMTGEEAQYLLDAMDTHVKMHGLKVALASVVILGKLQAAANSQPGTNGQVPKEATPGEKSKEHKLAK